MDRKETLGVAIRGWMFVLVPCAGLMCCGCSLDFLTGELDEPLVAVQIGDPEDPVASDEVLVRFVNRTGDDAVDVEFYATTEPLAKLPDDLFVEQNRVMREIGLAGRGVLAPKQADQVVLDCSADLTIGTSGGLFADADTGDENGEGDPRWAQDRPLGLCGTTVTFEFLLESDRYVTRISLGD